MKRLYILLALLASFVPAFGTTFTANSGQSLATIQTTANGMASGDTLSFAAGSYSWAGTLTVKCGVTLTGPVAAPATAIITETNSGSTSLAFGGPCTSGNITVTYLGFLQGGIYFGNANFTGVTITHNQFGALPSSLGGQSVASSAIYMNGSISTTTSNVTIQYNTFGDSNSCTAVFATTTDEGGYCGGFYHQAGTAINHNISYNTFNHVEEGLHYHQICSGCASGSNVSVANNVKIQYNYFVNWHRIAAEIQTAIIGAPLNVSHNLYVNPINPSYGTMFISEACCTGGQTNGTSTTVVPPNATYDNVLLADNSHIQTVGSFHAPVIGIEFWGGSGSFADWNYIGGGGSNGINWGYNNQPFYARNDYVCQSYGGTYITEEENQGALTQSNNTTSATCATRSTTAPTISQTSSQVTLSDPGIPVGTGMLDAQPISIYYTTDGSTPTVASTLYTAPFTPATNATVKAIAQWGVSPMPTSMPSGYGYVPSTVVSAVYTGTGGTVTLSSIALSGTSSLVAGGPTSQLTATGTYSNSTTGTVAPTTWTSNATSICTVSSTGLVTPIAAGACGISATLNGVTSPSYAITVAAVTVTGDYLGTTPTANINTLIVGNTVQMQEVKTYSNGTSAIVTATSYAVLSGSGCTITSPGGLVTATAASSNCTVQANGTSSGWGFTISAATLNSIALNGASSSLVQGTTELLSATGTYSSGLQQGISPTSWLSDNAAIASVDSSGNVTAVAPGTANITAVSGSVTSSAFTITVTQPGGTATLSSTAVKYVPTQIYVGQQLQLTLQGTYSNGTTAPIVPDSWSTTSAGTASIDPSTGILTALSPGQANVTALSGTVNSTPQLFTVVPYPFALSYIIPLPYGGPFAGPLLQSQILTPGVYTVTVTATGTTITVRQ